MGKISTTGGAGGSAGSDECTARLSDIPAGLKAVTADSGDEAGVGTMTMTGNAQAGHVLAGETFYTNDYKTKQTGTMTVGSLLSFSVAAYSGKRVLAKWQNPNQAAGKPYSGVMIRYSTGGYPGATGGTQIYKGAGNNTAAGGWSQAFLDMPALNTTYYFSCVPYVTCSAGEMLGAPINFTCATGADLWLTFTAGRNYTVPEGYTMMDAFAVGGGAGGKGGGGNSSSYNGSGGHGGGSGYTKTIKNISVVNGQVLSITVGMGGTGGTGGAYNSAGREGTSGEKSSLTRSGVILCEALGGDRFGAGGSGGGAGAYGGNPTQSSGFAGGFDGSDGLGSGGKGQGTTTRAFGESGNTLYSGGGGSGGSGGPTYGGNGGSGGGGSGGNGAWKTNSSEPVYHSPTAGSAAVSNTGSGGGGGAGGLRGYDKWSGSNGGPGGSGIVLLHLH